MKALPIEITTEEMQLLPEDSCRIIDIRTPEEYRRGTLPSAENIAPDQLRKQLCNTDKPAILVCTRGITGLDLAYELRDEGFPVSSLSGGYTEWMVYQLEMQQIRQITEKAEKSLEKKFRKALWCNFTKAINTYKLVQPGDRIAVCISGGKDSMLMAKLFQKLLQHTKFPFQVKYLVMDPGYSTANRQMIEENARNLSIPIEIFEADIFRSVFNVTKSPCYLCARMRRGYLYSFAKKLNCNKIALGHHFNDVIETILMGVLYGAQIQTMMPKLHSANFPGMELIRPLYLIHEDDIKAWRDHNGLHFLQCACKFTENNLPESNGENHSKRIEARELIRQLKKTTPDVENHIFRSVENVALDAVIAWKKDGKQHHFLDEYDSVSPAEEE